MKKSLILSLLVLIVLVTGCSKKETLICTKKNKIGVVEVNQTAEYSFEDGYAIKSKTITDAVFNNETSAETFAKNYKNQENYEVDVKGKKVKVVQTQVIAKESRKDDANKKENVKEFVEKEGFTCK